MFLRGPIVRIPVQHTMLLYDATAQKRYMRGPFSWMY